MTEELLQYLLKKRWQLGVAVGFAFGYLVSLAISAALFSYYWQR